jgi:hypothetical protein
MSKFLINIRVYLKIRLFYLKEYKPIFIVGLPRSGSSLTEQILINSPDVKTCGEVEILNYEFINNLNSLNENILKISE